MPLILSLLSQTVMPLNFGLSTLDNMITFGEYRALVGLLEHLRFEIGRSAVIDRENAESPACGRKIVGPVGFLPLPLPVSPHHAPK